MSSINDLRPHSSRNLNHRSDSKQFTEKLNKRKEDPLSESDDLEVQQFMQIGDLSDQPVDRLRFECMRNFGFPEEYISRVLAKNEASYCLAGYFLLGEDQNY